LVDLFESYDDARTCEHQTNQTVSDKAMTKIYKMLNAMLM